MSDEEKDVRRKLREGKIQKIQLGADLVSVRNKTPN